jgi:hypothetical protein
LLTRLLAEVSEVICARCVVHQVSYVSIGCHTSLDGIGVIHIWVPAKALVAVDCIPTHDAPVAVHGTYTVQGVRS